MRDLLASAHSACVPVSCVMVMVDGAVRVPTLLVRVRSPARSRQISITRLLDYFHDGLLDY
jgi:hypothetical protein